MKKGVATVRSLLLLLLAKRELRLHGLYVVFYCIATQIHTADSQNCRHCCPFAIAETRSMLRVLNNILPFPRNAVPGLAKVSFSGDVFIESHFEHEFLSLCSKTPQLLKGIQQCDFVHLRFLF